ncbi:hypothetical protein CHU98_g2314 [Xylaria longipes]|nr:hypothetical protein CHU98_g2314 [Xylaria longipes]
MSETQPVFEGRPGEDPEEYIEDVELHADQLTESKKGEKTDVFPPIVRSIFRKGLRGEARDWYLNLSSEKRKDWKELQDGLKRRFPLRVVKADPGLASMIDNLDRRPSETLAAYVKRSTDLSYRASDTQQIKLRDRLYKYMCAGGHTEDLRIQDRVTDGLFAKGHLDDVNDFKDICTFANVQDTIIACAHRPGQDNPFLDELGLTVARRPSPYVTPIHPTPYGSRGSGPASEGAQPRIPIPLPLPMAVAGPASAMAQSQTGDRDRRVQFAAVRDRSTSPAPNSDRGKQPWVPTCYNCTEKGHVVRDCPYEERPYRETQKIREALGARLPMPTDLTPLRRETRVEIPPGAREVPSALAKPVTAKELCEESDGVSSLSDPVKREDGRTLTSLFSQVGKEGERWDVYDLNEEHLMVPALSAETGKVLALAGEKKRRFDPAQGDAGGTTRNQAGPSRTAPAEAPSGVPRPPTPPRGTGTPAVVDPVGMRRHLEEQFRRLDERIQARKDRKKTKTSNVPIRLYEDHLEDRLDIGELLRKVEMPPMKFGQFVDIARGFKSDMSKMFQLSTKPEFRTRKKPTKTQSHHAEIEPSRIVTALSATLATPEGQKNPEAAIRAMLANTRYRDVALVDDGETYLRFITADVDGWALRRVLVDSGSLVELMSAAMAEKLGLMPLLIKGPALYLRVADDSASPITHFVKFPLVVGGILSIITAYVAGSSKSYDLLLGKGWLRRNQAVIDFHKDQMTLKGKQGHTFVVSLEPAERPKQKVITLLPDNEDLYDDQIGSDSESTDSEEGDLLEEVCSTETNLEINRGRRVRFNPCVRTIPDQWGSVEIDKHHQELESMSLAMVPIGRSLSETDLWIVNRLLNTLRDGPSTWPGLGEWPMPVWAPPPCTPWPTVPRWNRIVEEAKRSPRYMNIRDDEGKTVAALDGLDDGQLAFEALKGSKDYREDYCEYQIKYAAFASIEKARRRGGMSRDEPGLTALTALSQTNPGRPQINRRPEHREITRESMATIDEWIRSVQIKMGDGCKNEQEVEMAKRLAYTWKDCFVTTLNELRVTDLVQHDIVMEPGFRPFRLRQPSYNPVEREFAHRIFPQMEAAGLLVRGISPYGAHSRFPHKSSGELRVGDHVVFFQGDAANGFWSVPMNPRDQDKTAVLTPEGQWLNVRMAQGLTGSPHTYCALGDIGFGSWPPRPGQAGPGLPNLLGYHKHMGVSLDQFVDDHNASAKDWQSLYNFLHYHYFPRVAFMKIGLSPKKTTLFADKATVLGFELSMGEVRPSARHRARFAAWAREENHPKSTEELEEFLYLTPYLKQYIPGRTNLEGILRDAFTERVAGTTPTGRKSVQIKRVRKPFVWGSSQKEAFVKICEHVQQRSIKNPDPARQYHLAVDTSGTGVGGVLFQLCSQEKGTEITDKLMPAMRPLSFMSFRLSDAETRFNTGERETLGVVKTLAECRWLVLTSPYPVLIYCDHLNILKTFSLDNNNRGRIATWLERLGEYDVTMRHRPNDTKIIKIADGLSRLTGSTCTFSEKEDTEKLPFILDCPGQGRINPPTFTTIEPPQPARLRPPKSEEVGCFVELVEAVPDWPALFCRLWEKKEGRANLFPMACSGETTVLDDHEHSRLRRVYGSVEWYADVIEFLIDPSQWREMSRNTQKNVKRKAMRYRVIGGSLRYTERDGVLSYCVLPAEIETVLDWAHDGHGHFATEVTIRNLYGHFWWPNRYGDVMRRTRSCPPNCLVPVFGFPGEVYCDNAFKTKLVTLLFEGMGTTLSHGPVYAPWSHGTAEMSVRLLRTQLWKWASPVGYEGLDRWPLEVPRAVARLNARYMPGYGLSPSEIMLGWRARCAAEPPAVAVPDQPGPEVHAAEVTLKEGARWLDELRDEIQNVVKERERVTQRPLPNFYRVDDWVWEYFDPKRDTTVQAHRRRGPANQMGDKERFPKLQPRWRGPYRVAAIVSDVTLHLVDPLTGTGLRKVHVQNTKPYLGLLPEFGVKRKGPTTLGQMGVRELMLEKGEYLEKPFILGNRELDLRPQILPPPSSRLPPGL